MGLGQYLQDTRAELRHVAWPTQAQTIVYTVLVIVLSVFIALYLGLFDFIFTGTLARLVNANGGAPTTVTQQPITISTTTPVTPAAQAPAVDINSLIPGQTPTVKPTTNTKK